MTMEKLELLAAQVHLDICEHRVKHARAQAAKLGGRLTDYLAWCEDELTYARLALHRLKTVPIQEEFTHDKR